MDEPLTEELLDELRSASAPEAFLDAHDLQAPSLSDYLNQLAAERGMTRSAVVRAAGVNDTHGYQIFTGSRGAGRDTALQLAFALGCDLRQAGRLLRAAGQAALSPKSKRDAIIIYCLDHGASLQKCDEELYRFGEKTLCE